MEETTEEPLEELVELQEETLWDLMYQMGVQQVDQTMVQEDQIMVLMDPPIVDQTLLSKGQIMDLGDQTVTLEGLIATQEDQIATQEAQKNQVGPWEQQVLLIQAIGEMKWEEPLLAALFHLQHL